MYYMMSSLRSSLGIDCALFFYEHTNSEVSTVVDTLKETPSKFYNLLPAFLLPYTSTFNRKFEELGTRAYHFIPSSCLSILGRIAPNFNKITPDKYATVYEGIFRGISLLAGLQDLIKNSLKQKSFCLIALDGSEESHTKQYHVTTCNDYYLTIGKTFKIASHLSFFIEKLLAMKIIKQDFLASHLPNKKVLSTIGLACSLISTFREIRDLRNSIKFRYEFKKASSDQVPIVGITSTGITSSP